MFSIAFKKRRLAKGFSLNKLSEKSKIPISTLSKYENGEKTPNTDAISLLCKILKCTPGQLLEANPKNEFSAITLECANIIEQMNSTQKQWILFTLEGIKLRNSSLKKTSDISAKFLDELIS